MVAQQFSTHPPTQPWRSQQMHCDLSQRAVVAPQSGIWYSTSYTGIWFRCFEADSSVQPHPLTMLTRFDPGGFFPAHGHPGGEEILVLQGAFADETGVYGVGSYLLNPEGFSHLPYSSKGCITFVKLRQHDGNGRPQIRTNINDLQWQPSEIPQVAMKRLYEQAGFSEQIRIERWQPRTRLSPTITSEVKEIFVLEGMWADERGEYSAGTWLRYPPGYAYTPTSPAGCTLYVKTYPLPVVRFSYSASTA